MSRRLALATLALAGCIANSSDDKQRTIDALEAQLRTCHDQVAARGANEPDTNEPVAAHDDTTAAPPPEHVATSKPVPFSWVGRTNVLHRLELDASWGHELGGAMQQRDDFGGALRYYLTDKLGVGLAGRVYTNAAQGNASDGSQHEAEWSLDGDVIYAPFGTMHIPFVRDLYVDSGVGVIAARPVAADASRTYSYGTEVDFVAGAGVRTFVWPWLALDLEVRDTLYNTTVDSAPNGSTALVQDIALELGASLFFPFVGGA